MSARGRVNSRAQSRSSNTSNSSTPNSSRVRSTTARDNSSPYGSSTRRSNKNQNKLRSATSKHPNNKNGMNNENVTESHLSDKGLQQSIVGGESDDELSRNMLNTTIQVTNSQSNSAHTTLTNNFVQNFSLNDTTSTTSTILRSRDIQKNRVMNNDEVYKLFDKLSNGLFRCKLCQQELKNKRYNTTNLRKHIGLVHKKNEYLYPSQQTNYLPKSNSISPERKKKLDSAIVSCIIKDSRSFDDFRKSGMREFLSIAVPGYVPPHRTTIKANIIKRYREHRRLLRAVLAEVPEIALTSDVWKNSTGTHFISLTAHFFDLKYNLVSLTIGFRKLIGDHIAERLRKYILYELKSLQIENKICSITTDNASNIVCATTNIQYFGTRFSCLAHDLNLIIQDGLHLHDNENSEGSYNNQTTSSKNKKHLIDTAVADEDDVQYSSSDEDEDDEEAASLSSGDLGDDENLDESFNDEIETQHHNNMPSTDDTLMNIYDLINRTRDFVKLTRRRYLIRDYFKQEAKAKKLEGDGLILDCIIRWNSSYYMINRFINYKDLINELISNPRIVSSEISPSMISCLKQRSFCQKEWDMLVAVRDVLAKFEEACQLLFGKKYPTLSISYLVLVGLENHLSQPTGTGVQAQIELTLRKNLYDAYRYHVTNKIACFLDPQTHYLMNDTDKYEAQQYIINEVRNRNLSHPTISPVIPSNTNNSTSSNKNSNKNNHQLNAFLSGCGLQPLTISSISTHSNRTIQDELAYYMSKARTYTPFEEFWITYDKELPSLSILVRSFNVRPATSVPSESLFSIASYVNRKQRCSLSGDTLRYLMILRDADVVASLA
ncbi:unnamed protein product [Rotaria sordida]|uniref:BED-type domain-containing protein n=1 Tax=Rotaria sordida TaxID=392033 RepID=A0A819LZA8_9BILA|nr:unnamed protein product [Rotaria sordida]CAF3970686.1 unnamed protein product [Rotaria sordida]